MTNEYFCYIDDEYYDRVLYEIKLRIADDPHRRFQIHQDETRTAIILLHMGLMETWAFQTG